MSPKLTPVTAASHYLLTVQEAERSHLARELHDEIGQALTLISLTLGEVKSLAGPTDCVQLEDCCRMVDNALDQVRSLSLQLRPLLLEELGLEAAISWQLDRLAQRAGWTAEFDCPPSLGRFHPVVEITGYRVVQEALTNVVRHAQASRVWVSLVQQRGLLEVVVRDNGIGFDVKAQRRRGSHVESFGLLSMEQRVQLVRGVVKICSEPSHGTTVRAWLPVDRKPLPAGAEPAPHWR